nr:PAAR domain-containing protein [Citrobacter amalonaticus]
MGYRTNNYGRGQALHGDRTTTGATVLTSLPNCTEFGRGVIRVGDKSTVCPKCGKSGHVLNGEPHVIFHGVASAVDGVSLDIENYCTLRLFFDLSTLAGLSRRNLPEAGIRLLFQI